MGIIERRKREKEQRRNAIIDAAEEVFFSQGIETATMDDVAQRAELSKGTLYLYFNSKTALLFAIIKRGLENLTARFKQAAKEQKSGLEKVLALGREYIQFAEECPDYFHIMIQLDSRHFNLSVDDPIALECEKEDHETINIVVSAIREGIEDGSIRQDIDPAKMAFILWAQTSGIVKFGSTQDPHMMNHLQEAGFRDRQELIEMSFFFIGQCLQNKAQGE